MVSTICDMVAENGFVSLQSFLHLSSVKGHAEHLSVSMQSYKNCCEVEKKRKESKVNRGV